MLPSNPHLWLGGVAPCNPPLTQLLIYKSSPPSSTIILALPLINRFLFERWFHFGFMSLTLLNQEVGSQDDSFASASYRSWTWNASQGLLLDQIKWYPMATKEALHKRLRKTQIQCLPPSGICSAMGFRRVWTKTESDLGWSQNFG